MKLVDLLFETISDLKAEIRALQRRIKELEGRPTN